MKNVVILGAGPCGLSAAWDLVRVGYKVLVIEKESSVGGLCRSFEHKGFRFDLGGHRIISKNQVLLQKIATLMGDELLTAERKSVVLLNGKTFQYPLSAVDVFGKLNPTILLRAIWDILLKNKKNNFLHEEESFEDWASQRFGQTLYELFFKSYTHKFWGMPPRELSSDWAAQRIPVLKFSDIIKELINPNQKRHRVYAKQFYYPKKGIGQLFQYIADDVRKHGGSIHLDAKLTGISYEENKVRGVSFESNNQKHDIDCTHLISTIPLPTLTDFLTSPQSHMLSFRSVRFFNFLLDKPQISKNTWSYVPEKQFLMTRIQEPKRRSPFNAPEGKTSLMLEIPCTFNDDVWRADDRAIFKRSLDDLTSLGIDIKDKVMDSFSTYVKHGYPIYRLGWKGQCDHLLKSLLPYKNLILAGRQGLFRYVFMDQAMLMGMAAAERIIKNSTDSSLLDAIGREQGLSESNTAQCRSSASQLSGMSIEI